MLMSNTPESYPRIRWQLAFTRFTLWTRSASDRIGLGPSTLGRLCCALVLGAIVFGALLFLSVALEFSPFATLTLALSAFILVLTCSSAILLAGTDQYLIARRAELLRQLPEARAAWQAKREHLRREREKRRKAATVVAMTGPGSYDVDVVGESHYQKELEAICGGRTEESARFRATAVLILDDRNPHDSKAVRVEIGGFVVGHLNRENARQYRKKLSESGYLSASAHCKALIVGGWDRGEGDRGHFGVRLDLPTEE